MKQILYFIVISLLLSILTYGQLIVKDQGSIQNTLLQVNDEGGAGSITIPLLKVISSGLGKLYNLNGSLYWNEEEVGLSGSGGWVKNGNIVTLSTLTDYVGIGNPNPAVNLDITSSAVNFASRIRLANSDKTHNLYFFGGHSTELPYISFADGDALRIAKYDGTVNELMRITSSGNVGIGTVSPTTSLDVNGEVKITGGSPGDGKVLTSDVNGLASWKENNSNPKIGFNSKLSLSLFPSSGEIQLTNFSEIFDDGNAFDPTNCLYIVPSSGAYMFQIKITWMVSVNNRTVGTRIRKNGTIIDEYYHNITIYEDFSHTTFSSTLTKVTAGDQITFHILFGDGLGIEKGEATRVFGHKVY